ncbi:hypothetical protein ACR9YC_07405 [Parasphingorhabdus sp. DH2-15]|uniref:hypothetical protein n=1 Tax=Parasphingorhabdus sp. DH2-15 TaxID=3444112 RepID=UPI003F683AB9
MTNQKSKTETKSRNIIEEHPLAAATGALIVGMALGALIPRSESERKALRNTGDKLRERTKEAVSAAQEAGKTGLEDAGITVEEAKLQVRDLVRRASEAVHGASDAARETLLKK